MAENLTIARPYAQAVFMLACEHKNLEKWESMLAYMAAASTDKNFSVHLKSALNATSASDSMIQLLGDLIDEYGQNLIKVLGENKRFDVLPEILSEFKKLREQYEKVITATVISAKPLEKEEIDLMADKLSKKYDCKVLLSNELDDSIIGGAILKIGDKIIDASVKTYLSDLLVALK